MTALTTFTPDQPPVTQDQTLARPSPPGRAIAHARETPHLSLPWTTAQHGQNDGRVGVLALVLALAMSCAAAGCQRDAPAEAQAANVPPPAVDVGRENIIVVAQEEIATGPLISGTLAAEREATVRAEVAGSVLQVHGEEGQAVRQGAVLARIEDQTLRDAYASAESSVKSAENALDVAEREATRTANLVKAGALPDREIETTRNAVTGAQAQRANARAQLASARKQLDNATVRSPMTGVVSARLANGGDVVSVGTELFKVIDPSSMRLNAAVRAEALAAIKVGLPVEFQVRGYPNQRFTGRIERISPTADPVTRQVSIFVTIPNRAGRLVAGLFAEGRVTQQSRKTLVVPETAVNSSSASEPWVLRIKDGKAERATVKLGLRDDQTERVEIANGVQAGDQLLVGAPQALTPGTPVRVRNGQPGQTAQPGPTGD